MMFLIIRVCISSNNHILPSAFDVYICNFIFQKQNPQMYFIISSLGRHPFPGFVGYCMSKSATIALTTGLRVELAKWGVKAINIEPFFYTYV